MGRLTFEFYDIKSETVVFICRSLQWALARVHRYFQADLGTLRVVVAANQDQFCELLGEKRPAWGVTKQKNGTIYLYDPAMWDRKATGHRPSDLKESLAHALVHHYFFAQHISSPIWFEEGIAEFVSKCYRDAEMEKNFGRLSKKYGIPNLLGDSSPFSAHAVPALYYFTAYRFLSFLAGKSGEETLLCLASLLEGHKDFEHAFIDVYVRGVASLWEEFRRIGDTRYG